MDTTNNICGIEPSLANVGNIDLKVDRASRANSSRQCNVIPKRHGQRLCIS